MQHTGRTVWQRARARSIIPQPMTVGAGVTSEAACCPLLPLQLAANPLPSPAPRHAPTPTSASVIP